MHVEQVSEGFSLQNVVPFFQPIIDVKDSSVWRYEALARMLTVDQQSFTPSEFLYLVEKQQCHGALTEHIFHLSALYFRQHQLAWNINIAEPDILDSHTIAFLQRYLQENQCAHLVALELSTETAEKHEKAFRTFLLLCKTLGLTLVLDHFNGSLKLLDRLLELPVDGIKLPARQLQQYGKRGADKNKFQKIQDKANANEIALIAEHVESEELMAITKGFAIPFAQGFYISHPTAMIAS
ncbi:MAG: EAL domain-containing protein [Aestuariibacter sp.]